MVENLRRVGAPVQGPSSDWFVPVVVILEVLVVLGLIAAAVLMDSGIADVKTGKLSITIRNYDIEDRDISIYIDGEHSTDKIIPAGFEWTGLVELRWSGADSIKEISVLSGAGTQTKQVQMIEGSIASISFELS